MADQKITALTSLAQADIVSGTDVLPIVDVGAPSVTKKATPKAVVGASVNDLAQTWNAGGTTFNAIKMNVTDTASDAASLLMNLQVGSASQFKVGKSGIVTAKAQVGTITNDSAAAGQIGELLSENLVYASKTSLVNATPKTVISVSLTAGDWDVQGVAGFEPAGTTTVSGLNVSISATNNTLSSTTDLSSGALCSQQGAFTTGLLQVMTSGVTRVSLAATTTYYLVVRADFAVSTMASWGFIRARRMR